MTPGKACWAGHGPQGGPYPEGRKCGSGSGTEPHPATASGLHDFLAPCIRFLRASSKRKVPWRVAEAARTLGKQWTPLQHAPYRQKATKGRSQQWVAPERLCAGAQRQGCVRSGRAGPGRT